MNATVAKDVAMNSYQSYDEQKVIKTGIGNQLFLDKLSGRFFRSDYDFVKGTMLEVNAELARNELSVNELYLKNRLEPTGFGDYNGFGWHEGTKVSFEIIPQRFEGYYNNEVVNVIKYPVQNLMDNNYDKFEDF